MSFLERTVESLRFAFRLGRRLQHFYRKNRSEFRALRRVLDWPSTLAMIAASAPPLMRGPEISLRLKKPACSVRLRLATSDLQVFRQVFLECQYRDPSSNSPQYIVDAGANIGLSSVYFLATFPSCRVVAVEPHPQNVTLARQNLEAYGDRCRIVAGAVWNREGEIYVERGSFRGGDYWACTTQEQHTDGGVLVPAARIESVAAEAGFPQIDLLKIDIEGAEVPVFESGPETFLMMTKEIMIECHGDRADSAVCDALREHGFTWSLRGEVLHAVRAPGSSTT